MRIAVFHNRYQQRGGEDAAVDFDVELLRAAGHRVSPCFVDSRDLHGPWQKLRRATRLRRDPALAARVERWLGAERFDIAHVHNFFPLLTPSLHATLRMRGLPVVQTLHNYRLYCANGLFLRDGVACEDCVARGPWNAVRHGCYRGSRAQTLLWADATAHHRRAGTWERCVDRFVAPSEFARRKFVAAGMSAERIAVRANPVADAGCAGEPGRGGVYVGRLSREKGVGLLVEAWRSLPGIALTLVGAGPEEAALRRAAAGAPWIRFTGALEPASVRAHLAAAAFAVVPSLCYEIAAPLALVEALSAGRAVVVSDAGAAAEVVADTDAGLLFRHGDARSLAACCRRLIDEAELASALGRGARRLYEARFTPERGIEDLLGIYRGVLDRPGDPAARAQR